MIKQHFNNLPLFQKILLIVCMLVLCMDIFFFACFRLFLHSYDETLYQSTADTLSYVTASLETELDKIADLSDYIIVDSAIQRNLQELCENPNDERAALFRRDVYNAFYSHFDSNPYITSIGIVTGDTAICMGTDITEQAFDLHKNHEKAIQAQGRLFWVPGKEGHIVACVREIRQLSFLKLNELGVLYIVLDLDQLVQDTLSRFENSSPEQHFILLDGGKRIYPSYEYHDALCVSTVSSLEDRHHGYTISTVDGKKLFTVYGRFSNLDWTYLYTQDYNHLFQELQTLKRILALFIVFSALAALSITNYLLKNIFLHMDYLIEKIHAFGNGLSLPATPRYDYSGREDEIGQLHRAFDEMTQSVKVLRDENYDKQILLRDARIRILEQQINPHFLYNTLDTINWMAQAYQADDISLMVRSLANLFRASITGDKDLIPLSDELAFLNNYIQIQKIRFKERLDFQISVPDTITSIEIPKLCIQPLVENAVKYSMECSDETCTIRVTITEEANQYRIQVANTGSSFEDNLLEKLEQHSIKPQGTGVGLVNINSRLQLLYGEQYGLHIHNTDGMAIVILTIPKHKPNDTRRT